MPYTASLSPGKDRPGFNISFRHPCRLDAKGKPGLKVRRGLGTTDESEARRLVEQMNQLLADEDWWNANRHSQALDTFAEVVVDAFYDGLQASATAPSLLRDRFIHLPDRTDGYARVLFVGTTGAGKTSLLRHFIGSDPERDRFPSTSTSKTTVSDIEVIPSEGPYKAAVTFFSEHVIQANIEDCVIAAATAVWEKMPQDKVADRLLHHADQRFRLSYVLGSWSAAPGNVEEEDDWDFGTQPGVQIPAKSDPEGIDAEEMRALQVMLRGFVDRIERLASQQAQIVRDELLPSGSDLFDDAQFALEWFQSEIQEEEEFRELVLDIVEAIRQRFTRLTKGTLSWHGRSERWPELWTFESSNREDFLRQIRWFSSNYAPEFGRLLTPLVDGVRVKGPFWSTFSQSKAKVVYLDGQGLGHTPESSSSVTTHITTRFSDVDVILLVDNAEQPIQAAAQAVLRAVAAGGYYGKLCIAFTHFDQVKGANLPRFADKKAHVLASVHNYLTRLKDVLRGPIVTAIERTIDAQCFMLGGLATAQLPRGVVTQMESLLAQFEGSIEPAPLPNLKPTYDATTLGFAVQRAVISFQSSWANRLGVASSATTPGEHWTRVKALNTRIAKELDVEYDSLRPVADFVGRLAEEVSNYLDHPFGWTRLPVGDAEALEAVAPIRQTVFQELHSFAIGRLVDEQLSEWRRALDLRGQGSAGRRASAIRGIYELAAPIPGTTQANSAPRFLETLHNIVHEAVIAAGGEMLGAADLKSRSR